MSVLLLLATLALGEEPSAVVDGSVVRGTTHLAVAPQRFLAELRDPLWESRISGSGTRAQPGAAAGACQQVAYVSPNVVIEARYTVQRCATADGFQSTLVESNVFSAYRTRWQVVPDGSGARVLYEVDLTTSLWVPDSLVRSETRRAVFKMMKAMAEWSVQVNGAQ